MVTTDKGKIITKTLTTDEYGHVDQWLFSIWNSTSDLNKGVLIEVHVN